MTQSTVETGSGRLGCMCAGHLGHDLPRSGESHSLLLSGSLYLWSDLDSVLNHIIYSKFYYSLITHTLG